MKADLAEELRRIPKSPYNPADLLSGAKSGLTPDRLYPAEVIKVEPEEDFELPSAAVSIVKDHPLAVFDGTEPILLRDAKSTSYIDCDGMEYAILRGRYRIVNRTIVFFVEFDQLEMFFYYVVCHPDFMVAHAVRTCEERLSATSWNRAPVKVRPVAR